MISHLTNCCGCKACACACPKNAISFNTDREGFQNPVVSNDLCINCGLCETVCPVLSPYDKRTPITDYAAFSNDEAIRNQSSSGGVFSLLAEYVLAQNGVVFGTAFDKDFSVRLISVDNKDDLASLRGSKYLQSDTGNTFYQCKEFLEANRFVLYSGTPCQISGLKHFLKKEYDNLIAIDIICHGVPSPGVWKQYIKGKRTRLSNISRISFRDKYNGWHKYNLAFFEGQKCERVFYQEDPYMQLFLRNVTLRPSCYNCPTKEGRSGSDITLGDFWGIENILPVLDDNKGISLALINTEKGRSIFNKIRCICVAVDHATAISHNSSWHSSVSAHPKRKRFFRNYKRWRNFDRETFRLLGNRPSIYQRTFRFVKNNIRHLFR